MVKKFFRILMILPFFLVFSCSVNWFNDFNELREEEFSVSYNFYQNEEAASSENSAHFSRRYEIGRTLTLSDFPSENSSEVQKFSSEKVFLGWKFYRNSISKNTERPKSISVDENGYVTALYVSSSPYDFVADWGNPAEYTVKHLQQNISDDEYTEFAQETKRGVIGSETEVAAKDYEGFYVVQPILQKIIQEDGSTIVEIKYNRNKYTIKFEKNGGSGDELSEITLKYGAEYTLPENNFTPPDGKHAANIWNTKNDGTGQAYKANESVKNLSSKNGDIVILYAQWEYNGHDSSGSASNPIEDAEKISFALNSNSSSTISRPAYITISSLLSGAAIKLADWKIYRNYLGVISNECTLLQSEDKNDLYSSGEISNVYIYIDDTWESGEYTLNIFAEYNGVGVSKEITVKVD